MARELQPALHDIGKMVDHSRFGFHGHDFTSSDGRVDESLLKSLGCAIPTTVTWSAITEHMRDDQAKTREIFLLVLADHAASATSRGLPPGLKKVPSNTTTHSLWNPRSVRPLQRIDQPQALKKLFDWLATDPTEEDFYKRYETALRDRPEDLYAPLNVVSLGTHVRLVSRFYHFFEKYVREIKTSPLILELAGVQATTVEEAERLWQLRVIQGEVLFAQEPVRVRDLNVFAEVEAALLDLSQKVEVLVTSSYQFLAVLPVLNDGGQENQMLNDLLTPVLNRGLYVRALEARIPLDTKAKGEEVVDFYAGPLPGALRLRAIRAIERKIEERRRGIPKTVPPDVRAKREQEYQARQAGRIAELDAIFPMHGIYPSLPLTFGAAICEVCQMEQATIEWPKQDILDRHELCERCAPLVQAVDWPPPVEELCERCTPIIRAYTEEVAPRELLGPRCYALRRGGIRLSRLNLWTTEPRARVAWVRIVLDMARLSEGLEHWYKQYARRTAPQLPTPEVRLPLVAEFLRDYDVFLTQLGKAIVAHFGRNNVEAVFKGRGVINDMWCVKIAHLQDLLCLLKLWQDLLFPLDGRGPRFFCWSKAHQQHQTPHFPAIIELSGQSPIRILVTCSAARFPFLQHWRQMERERAEADDVYVQVVGKGEMRVSLRALGALLLKAETQRRRKAALVHLAEIATLSEALARVRLQHRDQRDADTVVYRYLREDLVPLGVSFQTIVTLAKIVGD